MLTELRTAANAQYAHLPQYANYFDDWQLARTTKAMTFRHFGMKLAKGEEVLVKPGTTTIWAMGFTCPSSVKAGDIK